MKSSIKNKMPIPVLMYHSIGIKNDKWKWNHLTCPFDVFENQLKALKRFGYTSISLDQLNDYIFYDKELPKKSVVLTFDDGYLDNWTFAYPLLSRYGFSGTIYVNPEFVDQNPVIRKRMDEVKDINQLETTGFLSWEELKIMENSGIMKIESHALTHTWYPKSNKIIDFRHPGDDYIWMTWNSNIEKKPYLQIDDFTLVQYGEPVYEFEKSLSGPRFFPDEDLKKYLCDYVRNNGSKDFFKEYSWRDLLFDELLKYKSSNTINESYETLLEYKDRILQELKSTKSILEKALNKTIEFHCWPGGSATQTGMEISNQLGFKLTNASNDIKEIRYRIKNNGNYRTNRINRLTPAHYFDRGNGNIPQIKYYGGFSLVISILSFSNSGLRKIFFKSTLALLKIINHFSYLK